MITRRSALAKLAGGALAASAAGSLVQRLAADGSMPPSAEGGLRGRINHSACRWCYDGIPLDALCRAAAGMGIRSIDLVTVRDFPVLRAHGLICAMVTGVPGNIPHGLNRRENHDAIAAFFEETIPIVAGAGSSEHDLLLRQPRRDGPRGGPGKLHGGPQADRRPGRAAQGHDLHGAAQQQGRPQGLHVRPHRLGRRALQAGRLGAVQAALRHLPHADHGGRRHPHDPGEPRLHRPLPHGRRSRPQRD